LIAEEEATLSPEPPDNEGGSASLFAWALEENKPPAKNNSSSSSLKMFSTLMLGVVILAVLLFVFIQRSSSKARSEGTLIQQPAEQTQSQPAAAPASPTTTAPKPSSPAVDVHSADDELQKIRTSRIAAQGPEREKMLRELKAAERNYPKDYRFSYLRAKWAIAPGDHDSHQEAFDAMKKAAQKAIDQGQAAEMLASLANDKSGDLSKLSHGHSEWNLIQQALREKDKTKLRP